MIGATQALAASDEQASRPINPLTAPTAETPTSAAARVSTSAGTLPATQPEATSLSQMDPPTAAHVKKKSARSAAARAKDKAALAPPQAKAAAGRAAASDSDLSSADEAVAAASEEPDERAPASPAPRAKRATNLAKQDTAGSAASPIARPKSKKQAAPQSMTDEHEEAPMASLEIPVSHDERTFRGKEAHAQHCR